MNVFADNILQGKVALVTGGGTGIGKEIARTLGLQGASLVICSRREDVINQTQEELAKEGIDILGVPADVRDSAAVENVIAKTLQRFKRLDIVVNNAAGNFPAKIDDLSYNGFKTIVDIDLLGSYNVSKAAYTAWLRDNGGNVINITAPFEHWGVTYQAHVAAAKTGVNSLTRTCAVEWAGKGIRVNAIEPGNITDTEGVARFESVGTDNPQQLAGTKQDIANAVLFLVSDAAQFISGECLRVDGGATIDMLKVPVD